MSPWIDALLRWTHVLSGVLWVGLLFSSFVEAQVSRDELVETGRFRAETRSRALHWAFWGAVSTWTTGMLLMAVVYYATLDNLVRREVRFAFKYGLTTEFTLATNEPVVTHGTGVAISLALVAAAFLAYEVVWKLFGRSERVAAAASLALLGLALFLLGRVFTGRAVFLHAGALLGTIMALNVWTRIWPAQKKILSAQRRLAPAPDPAVPALAAQRSKHNVYLSVPVLFAMISNHYPAIYDRQHAWALVLGIVLAGWAMAWWLYERSTGAAPDAARPPPQARPADGKA